MSQLQGVGPASGFVFRVDRDRGPQWYAKYRLPEGDGFESGAVVRGANRTPELAVPDPEHDADALRRRERQVKAGDLDHA